MRATPCPSYATQHAKLTIATADTGRLIRAALWGLRRVYRPGFQYKKTGVLLLYLVPAGSVQGSLFLRPDPPERVRLIAIVDQLNARHGRDRVRSAASGLERGWKLKAEHNAVGRAAYRLICPLHRSCIIRAKFLLILQIAAFRMLAS